MTKIEWDDSLSVGVNLIDEQHKMLIQKIKDLSNAVNSGMGAVEIGKTLGFMMDYTEFHFSTEERHMMKLNYPEYDNHKEQHEKFKMTVSDMITEFKEEGATAQLSNWINDYLINWLVGHIKSIDAKLGKFLKEKGIAE